MNDESHRIDRVEIRLTEQEAIIEDLNTTINAQWDAIDALKRKIERLAEQVENLVVHPTNAPEQPPHY